MILSLVLSFTAFSQHKEYEGSGDEVITLDKPEQDSPALLVLGGNKSGNHFSITGYEKNRNKTDLLVNTTDFYVGVVPVDLPPRSKTQLLEISAKCSWTLKVCSISEAPIISVGEELNHQGDYVLQVKGDASTATFSGNSFQKHVSITAYDEMYNRRDVLINTTDGYSGTVMIPKNTFLLEINATGDWSIKLEL